MTEFKDLFEQSVGEREEAVRRQEVEAAERAAQAAEALRTQEAWGARIDGTDPVEILGDKAELALEFLDFMIERDLPGAEVLEQKVPMTRPVVHRRGVFGLGNLLGLSYVTNIEDMQTALSTRGYMIGILEPKVIQGRTTNPRLPHLGRAADDSTTSSSNYKLTDPNVLKTHYAMFVEGTGVYLCEDGRIRDAQGKNVSLEAKYDGVEKVLVTGGRVRTHSTQTHRGYKEDTVSHLVFEHFYGVELEQLLAQIAMVTTAPAPVRARRRPR
jgi:hypothetical protein